MVESSKPKKQREDFILRKLHLRRKNFGAHLSRELRKALGKRSLPLRVGDKVKVMKGSHRGATRKVIRVERAKNQVMLDNLNRKKADGTETAVPLHPSNLMIVELDRNDERRLKEKKKEAARKTDKREKQKKGE